MINIAEAIYGNQDFHKRMRKMLVNTMRKNEAIDYRLFAKDDITQEMYLELMSREDEWGGEAKTFAFLEYYGRRVVVLDDSGNYSWPTVYPSKENSEYDHLITDDEVVYLLRIGQFHYELLTERTDKGGDDTDNVSDLSSTSASDGQKGIDGDGEDDEGKDGMTYIL